MKSFFKDNWFKIAIVIILVSFAVYHFMTSSQKRETTENSKNDLALQAKCADQAAVFYKQGRYDDNSKEFSSFYINHWNKKSGKCFIRINSNFYER